MHSLEQRARNAHDQNEQTIDSIGKETLADQNTRKYCLGNNQSDLKLAVRDAVFHMVIK